MLHGYNPPKRFLPYLSWTEIAALGAEEPLRPSIT